MPNVIADTLTGAHDSLLVALSVAIAVVASYTALDLAARVHASVGWARSAWLASAALAMGGGVWSMHFVAMLAFNLPLPVDHAPGLTILSLAIPVVMTGLGFVLAGQSNGRALRLVLGGLLMGGGIAAMHYVGMAAMQTPAELRYDGVLVVLSVLIAIGAATVALWMGLRNARSFVKLGAALTMGLATSGMHYTAMAGAVWTPQAGAVMDEAHGHTSLEQAGLALGIAAVTFLILFLGFVAAMFDRRFAALAEREAVVALRESEGRLQALTDNLPAGMVFQITMRQDGSGRRFVYISRSCERLTGVAVEAAMADPAALYATIAPEDRPALAAAEEAAIRDRTPFEFEARLIRLGDDDSLIPSFRAVDFRHEYAGL
jgi:NO-binding membrane sensor protein with MHYT domain